MADTRERVAYRFGPFQLDARERRLSRGSEVVLIGAQGGERVLAEEWARRLATINYEITCGISPRVPRTYA